MRLRENVHSRSRSSGFRQVQLMHTVDSLLSNRSRWYQSAAVLYISDILFVLSEKGCPAACDCACEGQATVCFTGWFYGCPVPNKCTHRHEKCLHSSALGNYGMMEITVDDITSASTTSREPVHCPAGLGIPLCHVQRSMPNEQVSVEVSISLLLIMNPCTSSLYVLQCVTRQPGKSDVWTRGEQPTAATTRWPWTSPGAPSSLHRQTTR